VLWEPENPIRRACRRRYAAWILYARAFAGSRTGADHLVCRAVGRALHTAGDVGSESEAHERVLATIRSEALALLRRRPPARPVSDPGTPWIGAESEPSVLRLLTEEADRMDFRHAGDIAAEMVRELPAAQRRSLEMLLLRRPPLQLSELARRRRLEAEQLHDEVAEGLDQVAASIRVARRRRSGGAHPDLKALAGYVDGALSGDEARAVIGHCRACGACGDRLGTMILLRTRAAKATLAPRLSRGTRVAALALTLALGFAGGFVLAQALAPNPWAELATPDTVPRWYHDFLYGYRQQVPGDRALAEGLDLLVKGRYAEAIARLEPLAGRGPNAPEASAYLGIAHYLSDDVSRATIDLLVAGATSSRAGRISDWYLANAFLRRGEIEKARARLRALAYVGDWVGRQAQELLARLDGGERVGVG
jgi:tetratricopeptide (TPR) repeat protein